MNLFELNKVNLLEVFTPAMDICKLNAVYRVTDIYFVDMKYGKKLVANIEENFPIYLPQPTYEFLDRCRYLFTQMVQRARSNGLGLCKIFGTAYGIEFVEL